MKPANENISCIFRPFASSLGILFKLHAFQTFAVVPLQIHWEVRGSGGEVTDVRPQNGTLLLEDGQSQGQIILQILPDDVPELTEEFSLVMTFVEGGAVLNTQASQALFRIR